MQRHARPPAVSGLFYPADAATLAGRVEALLAAGRGSTPSPKALIAPHAGYDYSGPTAGIAMAPLEQDAEAIERVVLLGPSHYVPLQGLAASSASYFETPLGSVPLATETQRRLLDLPQVALDDRPHRREHSLEVLLPFLQVVLGSFQVLPLVVGDAAPGEVAEVLDLVWNDDSTRFVISSDLSHFHDYSTAQTLDTATCRAIEALDPTRIGPHDACGCRPVNGLLVSAKSHGLTATTLDLRNSGDTAGPRDRVVGYGAWTFSTQSSRPDPAASTRTPPRT